MGGCTGTLKGSQESWIWGWERIITEKSFTENHLVNSIHLFFLMGPLAVIGRVKKGTTHGTYLVHSIFFLNVQRDDWGQKHDPVHAFHLFVFSGSRKKRILANRDVMAVKRRGEQNTSFRDHFRCLTSSGCKDQMYTVTIWESQS